LGGAACFSPYFSALPQRARARPHISKHAYRGIFERMQAAELRHEPYSEYSAWSSLPLELLIAVVALAAPHATSLPELLAPSRACRSWALAYRSEELWRALHAALSLPAGAVGDDAQPPPSWRERVVSATLGLSLLDCGVGPGSVELPLAEALPPEARTLLNSVSTPAAGGHVCVLSRGRLAVIHLPASSGGRGVTSALHSVRP